MKSGYVRPGSTLFFSLFCGCVPVFFSLFPLAQDAELSYQNEMDLHQSSPPPHLPRWFPFRAFPFINHPLPFRETSFFLLICKSLVPYCPFHHPVALPLFFSLLLAQTNWPPSVSLPFGPPKQRNSLFSSLLQLLSLRTPFFLPF